jgi:hypothetical protein
MTARGFLLVALLAGLPAGCAFGTTAESSLSVTPAPPPAMTPPDTLELVRLTTYRGHGITFRYPASWRYRNRGFYSNMTSPVVDLASQPTRNPCGVNGCWFPVRHMRPGAVAVVWEEGAGMVDPAHPPAPGVHMHVLRNGCRVLGGDEELLARVVLRKGRIYEAMACLRGPGVPALAGEVRAMLASARAAH